MEGEVHLRRWTAVLLAAVVVASCSSSDDSSEASGKTTKISFWVNWEGDDAKALRR